MKSSIKSSWQLTWLMLAAAVVAGSATPAFAEKTGNGGGAWVCRETNGSIRWIRQIDLFELENQTPMKLARPAGDTHDLVDQMSLRLFRVDQDLYQAVEGQLDRLNYLDADTPNVQYTQESLEVIDDALWKGRPDVRLCAGGILATDPKTGQKVVPYEQIINYGNDGEILVQSELFNSDRFIDNAGDNISDLSRAALIFHEGVYAYRRTVGDTDSVLSRKIVGLVFSTLSTEDLKKALADLGESEIGAAGMKFVPIHPGSFVMGSPDYEDGYTSDEEQHLVTLTHGFEMQATDVTQAQWAEVMGSNPSFFKKPENCPKTFKIVRNISMCPINPIESVSYNDAQVFISKLNSTRRDGYIYRLPTEAEWEYAARAGTQTPYFFGVDATPLFQYAWLSGNSGKQTHEVAQLKANPWGLYDIYGNVWQWVSDYSDDVWYRKHPSLSIDPTGPASGSARVIRGGSWNVGAKYLRSASRTWGWDTPGEQEVSGDIGFRLVRQPRAF